MAVGNPNRAKAERGIIRWIDDRFPLTQMWQDHMSKYYASKNLNFWYVFGVLSLLVLVNQIDKGRSSTLIHLSYQMTKFTP